MFKDFYAKLATITGALLLSTVCVMSAVGPASANGAQAVASAARLMA